jgi:hypothetical protein
MQRLLGQPNALPTFLSFISLEGLLVPAGPSHATEMSLTNNPIRYHTTEARRLLQVTTDGLTGNGIVIDSFGAMKAGKYILCGGLRLTAHAADQLHPSMGGTNDAPMERMDPKTVTFM